MTSSGKTISSEKVGYNFSQAAFSYERAAKIQREAAVRLVDFMDASLPRGFRPETVIELGAGTGFVTKRLVLAFEGAKILVTDISDEMLGICRRKIFSMTGRNDEWMLDFEMLDFNEDFEIAPDCGLVVSGLSFQWAADLRSLISRICAGLPSGGYLAFSILLEGSLDEFRSLFEDAGVEYPVPPHPELRDIREFCAEFADVRTESYTLSSSHSGIRAFLQSLRNIGAVNPGLSKIQPGKMKRILSAATRGEFTASYHIANMVCRK